MTNPFKNKKKIRGGSRIFKKINELEKYGMNTFDNNIQEHGRSIHQLWISPFSNLTPRRPPSWVYKKYFTSMTFVAGEWNNYLSKRYANFYLAVWHYSPRSYRSSIVAAVGEWADYYRSLFIEREITKIENLPVSPLKDWESYWDHECFSKISDELTDEDISRLVERGAKLEKINDDEIYLCSYGTVWVSSVK